MEPRSREEDRLRLHGAIQDWNATRMDLFEISDPDMNLEFHGVMRFFFQDATDRQSNSKCIRVSSTATTRDVVNTLIEKFHPDMRMLSIPDYSLFELQRDMDDRQLQEEERPLYVQLNWTKDLKEGRFLLRQVNDPTKLEFYNKDGKGQNFEKNSSKRLSKREKKELKKERKQAQLKGQDRAYDKVSSSNFTRTISNPENVLKRKRQQKQDQLEKFKHRPESGGAFKVFAHTTFPEVPYKTLLISINTNAAEIVRESLEKFGAQKANPADFCLAKVVVPPGRSIDDYSTENFQEAVLDEDEYPMDAVLRWPESRGELAFELKRKPADHIPRLKRPGKNRMDDSFQDPNNIPPERLPYFLELNNDGTDIIDYKPKHYRLQSDVTEVGSQRDPPGSGPYLQFVAPDILPRHCVMAKMEGVVTVTPSCAEAEIYVVGEPIYETTILQHGAVVQFGRQYTFRFCDPQVEDPDWEDRNKSHVETTFDADGSIETYGSKQEKIITRNHAQSYETTFDSAGHVATHTGRHPQARDPNTEVLPLSLEFRDTGEDTFFDVVVRQVNGAQIYFKLAPTYALYLACRYRLSKLYRPEMGPTERAQRLSAFLNKMADIIDRTVEEESQVAGALTFWLANVSELLHFIQADRDIGGISHDAQDILHTCVQNTFRHLVRAMQLELNKNLSAFLDPSDEADVEKDLIADEDGKSVENGRWMRPPSRSPMSGRPTIGDVLQILSSAMTLLRVCRVNAALTIQLFSQLFHFIGAGLFNRLVSSPRHANLCTQEWGHRLVRRLSRVVAWAEKQGLEVAAETHFQKLKQALELLTSPKENSNQLNAAIHNGWMLNSRQMKAILDNYIPPKGSIQIPPEAIAKATSMAASEEELQAQREGHPILIEEERELRVPAFLPDDGYSSDIIKGVPNGLGEFFNPLIQAAQVRLTPHPKANGTWTVHMHGNQPSILDSPGPPSPPTPQPPTSPQPGSAPHLEPQVKADAKPAGNEPEVYTIQLNKHGKPGMGLSIIAATGAGQEKIGIYVKAVVPGSAADVDGRVKAGDQILAVDGNSLLGLDQDAAAQFLVKSGQIVEMTIAKQGAIFHGLAQILSQSTPPQQRAYKGERQPRPVSEDLSGRSGTLPPGMGAPRESMEPRGTATMPRGIMGVPLVGLREADKARSSPNLAEERPPERGNYMPMTSSNGRDDYSRHGSVSMRPEPRSRMEATPTPPISQRSKSVSHLDPEPMEHEQQRPVKSTVDLSQKRDEQPYRGHAPREEPPFRREEDPRMRPGTPEKSLESFDQEPYRRQPGSRPSDPRRESPDPRGPIPQQRSGPNQIKPSPQPRQVQQQMQHLQQRHRGPSPQHPGQYPQGPMGPRGPLQRMPMPQSQYPPGQHPGMGPRGPPPQQRMPDGAMQQPPPNRYGPPPGGFRVGPQGEIQRQAPPQDSRDNYGMPPRQRNHSQGDMIDDVPEPRARVYSEGNALRGPEHPMDKRYENQTNGPQAAPRMVDQQRQYVPKGPQRGDLPLPPPPPDHSASQGPGNDELPPPPPQQMEDEEEYRRWQERRAHRMGEDPSRQSPNSGFASLPRQGRINRSSSLTRDTLPVGSESQPTPPQQKPPLGPKPVPPPMPPERTNASAEAARGSLDRRAPNPSNERYEPPRANLDQSTRSIPGISSAGSASLSSKSSPWDREEKERQEKRLEEQVRQMRDDEVDYMSSLPSLNAAQQERLNKMKLDQQFQQRLEESMRDNEDDDEEDEDISRNPEFQNQMAMANRSAEIAAQKTREQQLERERQEEIENEMRKKQEMRVQELQMQRQQERQREMETQRQQELHTQQEFQRKQEMQRQQEVQRQQELRQQEMQRQKDAQRQQELQRQQEMQRQEDMRRQEEMRRKEEMRKQEEMRRQDEMQRQQEEQRQLELQRQEEGRQRQQELQRQEEERQRQQEVERRSQQQVEMSAQMELKKLQEERAKWMKEQEELRRQADEERRKYEEMKRLREQEEEMQRRHHQQRLEFEKREAELEQERRRLEQISFSGQQGQMNDMNASMTRPGQTNMVHATVSAGYVPGPNRPYVQAAPPERPPTDGYSNVDAASINKPKPFRKGPPPVAPKRVTFRPGQRSSTSVDPLNNLGSAGDRGSISSQQSVGSNNSGGAPAPQPPQSSFGNGYANTNNFHTAPVGNYMHNHNPTPPPPPPPATDSNDLGYSTPPQNGPPPVYRTGNTPGVIGAQEVYNDPRDKRLAKQQLQPKATTPDMRNMSFRDKMKLFSESTPDSKPRTSKWEREFIAMNPNLHTP